MGSGHGLFQDDIAAFASIERENHRNYQTEYRPKFEPGMDLPNTAVAETHLKCFVTVYRLNKSKPKEKKKLNTETYHGYFSGVSAIINIMLTFRLFGSKRLCTRSEMK